MSDLRHLRVDPPEGDFRQSLHRKLAAAGLPDEPSIWRRFWPTPRMLRPEIVVAPALGVAVVMAVFLILSPRAQGPAVAASLPATKVAVVRVNLAVEVAVESAQIQVSLPEGLYFWADGEQLPQRSFEWTQPLRKGDNDIPIAVRGDKPGKYRMTVTARVGGERIEDEVVLEVTSG